MSTISSQSVDAIVARLNESSGRPSNLEQVQRGRRSWPTRDEIAPGKRWLFVALGKNTISKVDDNGLTKQNALQVSLMVMGLGDATTAAEVAIDPVVAWCTTKLDGWQIPNLAEEVEEIERDAPEYGRGGDYPACRQELTYLVHHTSRIGNAELRY